MIMKSRDLLHSNILIAYKSMVEKDHNSIKLSNENQHTRHIYGVR